MRNLSLLNDPTPKHPAKYNQKMLDLFSHLLIGYNFILDPFAGTGEALLSIRPDAWLNEIEPRWASISKKLTPRSFVGDATDLPWRDGFFDAIVTSPVYGNRMSDHHEAKDTSKRNTYRHVLGEALQPRNTGQMQWGEEYRELHKQAWKECYRVLRLHGRFILNIKDHIRKGELVEVTRWHTQALCSLGFEHRETHNITLPGNRQGANFDLRVDWEHVLVFRKN